MSQNLIPQRKKNTVRKVFKVIIAVGIFLFLIIYVDTKEILERLKGSNFHYILIAVLLAFPNILLQFLKWNLVCRKLLHIENKTEILKSLFYGIGAGTFTPMKIGEYFARAIPFSKKSVVEVTIATVIDKLIPMFIVILSGITSMIFFLQVNDYSSFFSGNEIVAIILFILIILMFIIILWKPIRTRIWYRLKNIPILKPLHGSTSRIKSLEKKSIFVLIALSSLLHLTFTIQMSFLLSAFANEINFFQYFIVANLVIFTQVILLPIGLWELAIREGAAVFYTEGYGMAGAIGFNAGLLLWILNIVLPSIIGFFLLLTRDK